MSSKATLTASVIGSGPNGLSAAIVLAAAGLATTVFERNAQIGGACSTAEITLPTFRQDLGSSVYTMGVASPFFRSLPVHLPWIEPTAPRAHPLDDRTAVMLEHSIEATVATLDACDASRYRSLIAPVTSKFAELSEDILGPIQHVPRHPFVLARFASSALQSAASLARSHFTGKRAQAFFAGMATHSVLSLEALASAAVALTLMAAGHANGWPILRGGAQALPDALVQHLEDLGGRIEINHEITQLPEADLILADITPRQLLRIAGYQLPSRYCRRLERFRYGAGAYKIDYALSAPIPWAAPECSRAATVHIGARLKKLSSRSELSPLIAPSCFSVNHRSSTRVALQLAGILPGPTAAYLTEARKTILSPSNGRSHVSLRTSAIAFWPDPFPHPRRLRSGTQI